MFPNIPSAADDGPTHEASPERAGWLRMARLCFGAGLMALALALLLAQDGEIDLRWQDPFFDPARQAWMVASADPIPRLVFYRLPKLGLAALGLALLGLASWPRAAGRLGVDRRRCLLAFAVLAATPLVAGAGKQVTGVHCPCELRLYGGLEPYLPLFASHDPADPPLRPGRCFPAAHASGGFGLLGLVFLARGRRQRRWLFALALASGWLLGLYQQARGVHFVSHTLAAMGLALVVFGTAARCGAALAQAAGAEQVAQRP